MARYDYRCSSCGHVFEVEHRMSEHPEIHCPKCGKLAQHVFQGYGIQFKGTGFYNTDMKGKGAGASAAAAD